MCYDITRLLIVNRIFSTILIASIFLGPAAFADQTPVPKPYTSGPYKVEAVFEPDRARIMAGEPFWILLTIVNIGNTAFRTEKHSLNDELRWNVTITDTNGHIVAGPPAGILMSGLTAFPTVNSGDEIDYDYLGNQRWTNMQPGVYTVTCERPLTMESADEKQGPNSSETVDLKDSFILQVDPYDDRRMGAIIDSLGLQALAVGLGAEFDPVRCLSTIDDERTIDWYCKIINRYAGETDSYVITGLSQFSTVPAVQTLVPLLTENWGGEGFYAKFIVDTLKVMLNRSGTDKKALLEVVHHHLLPYLTSTSPDAREAAMQGLKTISGP